MSWYRKCDICKKTIKKMVYTVRTDDHLDYCEKCWSDKKNWSKIHKIEVLDSKK